MRNRSHSKKLHKNQEGALLLIALVLLGVIVLSTVYLSLVLLSEIKSTRYTDNGIVSHYVAESGIENALWKLKLAKQSGGTTNLFTELDGKTGQCAAEQNSAGVCSDPERTYDYNKVAISAPDYTVYDVPKNSVITADIYDPAGEGDPAYLSTGINQVDVAWFVKSCSVGVGVTPRLEITYTPVSILNPAPGVSSTQVDVCDCDANLLYGVSCGQDEVPDLNENKFYRFTFRSLDTDIKKLVVKASSSNDPKNIPSQVEIQSTGTYRESQKKITARTLWRDALSGIFGFVVFSEQSLIKDAKSLDGAAYGSRCGFCSFSTPATKSGCSTNADCQQCVSGKCLDGTTVCGSSADCALYPLLFTCSIANNTIDTVDAAATAWFCPLETTGGETASPILQTNAGLCNASCNGYTRCGDGTIQTPNGSGDGYNSGIEECDAGSANSDTLPLSCRIDCRIPYCGDYVVDSGNFNNGGVITDYTEECDEADIDICEPDPPLSPESHGKCTLTFCGDRTIQTLNGEGISETCDQGAALNGSGSGFCKSDCSDIEP